MNSTASSAKPGFQFKIQIPLSPASPVDQSTAHKHMHPHPCTNEGIPGEINSSCCPATAWRGRWPQINSTAQSLKNLYKQCSERSLGAELATARLPSARLAMKPGVGTTRHEAGRRLEARSPRSGRDSFACVGASGGIRRLVWVACEGFNWRFTPGARTMRTPQAHQRTPKQVSWDSMPPNKVCTGGFRLQPAARYESLVKLSAC